MIEINIKQLLILTVLTIGLYSCKSKVYKLWNDNMPSSTDGTQNKKKIATFFDIQEPSITVYLPKDDINTHIAVVICPGGGYDHLAIKHEGHDIAKWLNEIGITGIVLKYRLPSSNIIVNQKSVALIDAQRSIRKVRSYSNEWGIDKCKIGIIGFSAGGHIASLVGTQFDFGNLNAIDSIERESCRPDFMILVYPVISMIDNDLPSSSKRNLLGSEPTELQMIKFSSHKHIAPDTPPTILIHSSNDSRINPTHSIMFYQNLLKNGVSAEIHLFNSGNHGFGLGRDDESTHNYWPKLCEKWIKQITK